MLMFHMLLTKELPPKPDNIQMVEDWGYVKVLESTIRGPMILGEGNHILVKGEEKDIVEWLSQCENGFLLGKGAPMSQEFEVSSVKDELLKKYSITVE